MYVCLILLAKHSFSSSHRGVSQNTLLPEGCKNEEHPKHTDKLNVWKPLESSGTGFPKKTFAIPVRMWAAWSER